MWPPKASGSTTSGRQLLSECDIVIHSAAAVSFDSPLDAAVEVNLLGPSRVAAATVAARELAAEQGRTGPIHYLPVSTAYVAGTHQGEAREELLGTVPVQRGCGLAGRSRGVPPSTQ